MNCQHCGTELDNKRAKNCKACSGLLQEANRCGTYSFVMEVVATAKADGLTGTEMHETMRSAMKAGAGQRAAWADEYRKQQAERKVEQSQRIQFYQTHGYWPDQDFQGEDAHRDIEQMRAAEQSKPRPGAEDEIFG